MECISPWLQKKSLPANTGAHQKLKEKVAKLKVKFIEAKSESPITNTLSSKKYLLESNSLGAKAISFYFNKDNCEMIVNYEQGDRKLHFGMNYWEKAKNGILFNQQLPFPVTTLPNVNSPVACKATWKDDQTLYMEIRPVETVTSDSITCYFTNDVLKLAFLESVARAGKQKENRPPLIGRIS